ncbi:hypothetical protein GOQ27_04240 [Clostridium sp. D2Q-11]|uniref:DUF3566 domain-containing protein n=1 Tax=Anaeromonas frigoriresistens TaxID=2683708 RepID=A0A942UQZ3_9FIRM|nr:hypothetical protein [Anaeromonas frigoriresistens]MBS4537659.1 hypothetical protein [Anaeromonas frigoriresistens]
MKKIEIKKFGIGSLFKVALYFSIIPVVIMFLVGLVFLLIGIAGKVPEMGIFGVVYMVLPIFMVIFYGVMAVVAGLIYSGLASKFGGLEIYVTEDEESTY